MSKNVRFDVEGMHCQSCAMLISMNLDDLAGVTSVDVDYANDSVVVEYDPDIVAEDRIAAEIEASGYAVKGSA